MHKGAKTSTQTQIIISIIGTNIYIRTITKLSLLFVDINIFVSEKWGCIIDKLCYLLIAVSS